MAYIDAKKKQKIKDNLKSAVPRTWKYTVSFPNHTTARIKVTRNESKIVANVALAEATVASGILKSDPADHRIYIDKEGCPQLMDTMLRHKDEKLCISLCGHCRHANYKISTEDKSVINKIIDALNTDNFDKSDIYTDYHHVGHYVECIIYDC